MPRRRSRIRTIPLGAVGIGATELVAAPAETFKRVVVVSYLVVMDGAGTFKFQSAATDISDAVPADDKGGVAFSASDLNPALACSGGEALNIVTTGGIARGHLTYYVDH